MKRFTPPPDLQPSAFPFTHAPRLAARGRALLRLIGFASAALIAALSSALATAPPEAVGSLYLKQPLQYLCTASAVDGPQLGLEPALVILTAAHCVEPHLVRQAGDEWSADQRYQVSFDGLAYFDVTPYRVGFAAAGFDAAILLFEAGVPDLTPLQMGGWETIDFGTPIQNYANPLGMGIQYFTGSVTMLRIEPSPANRQRQWFGNAVAALQVGPGSSGSLILNEALEYVGVLSGVVEARFGSPFTVFVPQWKIVEILSSAEAARVVTCARCEAGALLPADLATARGFVR